MERLTHPRVSGIKTGYWTTNKKDELVARLAEYEDTGLNPQEIMELKGLYQERCAELKLLQELKEQQENKSAKEAEMKKSLPKMHPKTQKKQKTEKIPEQQESVAGDPVVPDKKKDEPSGVPGPYKGFMHIQCPQCGVIRNFCVKKETETFYCDKCNAKVQLENMAKVLLRCECGKVASYYTNRYDAVFDIECVQCQAPVCVEWNKRAKKYTTISNGGY